ncbi:MAG TPA: LarC family nickel insertion protein, partial [Dehalococcoidia bacterium]|nr:LarC family nickel insertion protein [Dehalococcoidia bacterium]
MSRIAYLDCFSGISGDMLLGAMVDAGLDVAALERELAGLAPGLRLRAERVKRGFLAATGVTVHAAGAEGAFTLGEGLRILESTSLPPQDRRRAATVLRLLAEAEARVHGSVPAKGRLHGPACDTLADIAGAVAGLRLLGVAELFCSPLPAGRGWTESPHGPLPLPAPAALEILARAGAPVVPSPVEGELVTPTGAAIVAALARFQQPAMILERVGYGAGGRDLPSHPNALRLWLGRRGYAGRAMLLLETNVDDMSPELLAHARDALLAAGAADAWLTPIQMKKGRPAVALSALCIPEQ